MQKIILNKFFKRFVCFFLIFSILFLSCFRLYAKPQKAEAFAPALIGLGVAVAFGLVTLGIAVTNTDVSNPGADKTNALAYACDFWEQKKQEAIAKGLVTAFEVNQWLYNAGAGLYDTTSACYDWIKEAAHNIYNNASYFQASANAFQMGNLNTYGNCRYLSGDFYFYLNGRYLFSSALGIDVSKFKGKNYLYHVSGSNLAFLYGYFSSYSAQFCFASPDLSVEYYSASKGCWTSLTYNNYSFGSSSYDGHSVSYYYFGSASGSRWGDLSFSSSNDITMDSDKSFTAFLGVSALADFDTLPKSIGSICQSYYNLTSAGTGISAQVNQSAKNLYTGADTNESAVDRILKGDTYVSYNIGTSSGAASSGVGTGTGSGSGSLGGDVVSPGDSSSTGTGSVGLGNDVIGKSGVISCPTTPDDISATLQKLLDGEKSLADVLADAQAAPYVVGKIDSKTGVLNPTSDPSIAANPSIADGVTTATIDVSTGELIKTKDETTGKPKYKPYVPPKSKGSSKNSKLPKFLTGFLYQCFPFCLPFDVYSILCVFVGSLTYTEASPPVITLDLSFFNTFFEKYGYKSSSSFSTSSDLVKSNDYSITIDLSPFDRLAMLLRALWEVLFVIGLAKNAKKFMSEW